MWRYIFTSIMLMAMHAFAYCQQDRRCRFYDLSKLHKNERVAHSSIIQFYSSSDNIGNYLPILGIQRMLGIETDLWCMHDKNIDFDFINNNYSCAIIGGAGLLNACFESFWQKLDKLCTLPMIMWGLGLCLPYKYGNAAVGVSKKIVQSVAKKCDLINVRDILTAQYYKLDTADISACPTVAYLQNFKKYVQSEGRILYSAHSVSIGKQRSKAIIDKLKQFNPAIEIINNIQRKSFGLEDIITTYCKSSLVITSRLHGAIIAYGLGIPCIMIPGDYKMNSFYRTYGYGTIIKTADDCIALLSQGYVPPVNELDIASVHAFGQRARAWCHENIQRKQGV